MGEGRGLVTDDDRGSVCLIAYRYGLFLIIRDFACTIIILLVVVVVVVVLQCTRMQTRKLIVILLLTFLDGQIVIDHRPVVDNDIRLFDAYGIVKKSAR